MSALFTFQGRLGRLAYFGYLVFLLLLGAAAAFAASVLQGVSGLLAFVLIAVVVIVEIWAGLSVVARRLISTCRGGTICGCRWCPGPSPASVSRSTPRSWLRSAA